MRNSSDSDLLYYLIEDSMIITAHLYDERDWVTRCIFILKAYNVNWYFCICADGFHNQLCVALLKNQSQSFSLLL
jgi:hypothetical protein